MAARRRILFTCFVNALVFSKFDDLRNTAYGAREGERKSLPRGEGFRERVTCTQKVRLACGLRARGNPQISACVQQVCQLA